MPFFIIFLIIPLIEIAVFMMVGDIIGLGWTLFFAFFTAILGGAIIRHQGLQALASAQGDMRENRLPVKEIFDGFCLVAAGATLITPGFVTDAIGFTLLVPTARDAVRHVLTKSFKFETTGAQTYHSSATNVLEGEYERVDEEDNNKT